MCYGYGCRCHGWYPEWHHIKHWAYHPPLMTAEEEAKELEKYRRALEKQLERVNRRLKELNH
ncbi:MAG: DUF5320 domain-containing protein [Candidatus Bathyarchaeota archaeon]|nr:DUF5320 domain-containing protein [Candidatus Bathyarchaeota archaeon]